MKFLEIVSLTTDITVNRNSCIKHRNYNYLRFAVTTLSALPVRFREVAV